MERELLPLPPSVIEGVLDVTTVYYITVETRVSDRPASLSSVSCQASAAQETSLPKSRPVATVRPFTTTTKSDQEGQASDPELPEISEKETTCYEDPKEGDENFSKENSEEGVSCCNTAEESDRRSTAPFDPSWESREEGRVFPSPSQPLETPSPPPPQPPPPPTPLTPSKTKLAASKTQDPCRHRDKLRAAFDKPNSSLTFSSTMMEVYQNGEECYNGQGCAGDFSESLKETRYRETSLTECLDEFLEELQLTHLRDYLRVLGCTCVRDLKLLEDPELNAIQLISRRRLLKRLESMSLHHEAPPSDCSLEGWLTWYGLTHISGFLNAIGVLTVADISYLREEDLELLKPVTRRRLLSLYRK